jgi:hypothetical protein
MARPEKVRLGEILLQQKLLYEDRLQLTLTEQKANWTQTGPRYLLKMVSSPKSKFPAHWPSN